MIIETPSSDLNLVYITDNERPTYYGADQLIKNHESASIILNKFVNDKLGEPHNHCINDIDNFAGTDLVKKTIEYNSKYTREMCRYLCFFKQTAIKYNCDFPKLYEVEQVFIEFKDLEILHLKINFKILE